MHKAEPTNFEAELEEAAVPKDSKFFCCAASHFSNSTSLRYTDFFVYDVALKVARQGRRSFYASASEIGAFLGLHEKSVRNSYLRLEDSGWFVLLKKRGYKTKEYRVLTHQQWTKKHPAQCAVKRLSDAQEEPDADGAETEPRQNTKPTQQPADSRKSDSSRPQTSDMALTARLTRISDNVVTFNKRTRGELERLRGDYSDTEIERVFSDWVAEQDLTVPRNRQWAAQDFVEAAPDLLSSRRVEKESRAEEQRTHDALKLRLQEQAEADRRAADEREKEDALLFDPLAEDSQPAILSP